MNIRKLRQEVIDVLNREGGGMTTNKIKLVCSCGATIEFEHSTEYGCHDTDLEFLHKEIDTWRKYHSGCVPLTPAVHPRPS